MNMCLWRTGIGFCCFYFRFIVIVGAKKIKAHHFTNLTFCQLSQMMFSMWDKKLSGLEGLSVTMLDVWNGYEW